MKELTYVIKDEIGIHARPAGNLVRTLKDTKSKVTIECKGKSADAKKIFSLLSLAAKCGDVIKFIIDGEDEEKVYDDLLKYLNENL
ncbi:MAG: HPr family phosphocarrier protein [Clostridia bacterium]|nr:HPr family phosphocarrier protein [Clostridia bacterium]